MANIWIRGLKSSYPTALINTNFIQRSFAYFPKGEAYKLARTPGAKEIFEKGEHGDMGEKITSILTRKSKPVSGGLIKMFSSAATASENSPKGPGINTGPPPKHDNQPVETPEKQAKDTVSDPKNRHEKPSKN